jgi:serine protease Do
MRRTNLIRFIALLSVLLLSFAFSCQATHERRSAVVEAVDKAGPAVVNIRTEQIVKRRSSPFFGFADPFFEEFFRDLAPPRIYRTQSLGSGVIIDPRGYILTNAHVIEKASKIYAALPHRKKELEAKLVGLDERIDLAVIKIEGRQTFPFLPPARSDDLMVGETVVAIGNPLGLGHSITTGVVSAPRRRIPMGEGIFSVFIQTDALINPGNSGGPLININGELIGINTAIARQAQGIGFAIPIDTVKRVLSDLMEFGCVRRAFLGVISGPVGQAFTKARGEGGVLVDALETGSPAAVAGLKVGDVILALDDILVASPAEFLSLLRTYTPEDLVRVSLLRGTELREVAVRLDAIPKGYGLKYGERVFGLAVVDTKEGIIVSAITPGSAADKAGIRSGDLVAELAGERLKNAEDYARVIESQIGQEPLRFLIVRGSRGYYVDLP